MATPHNAPYKESQRKAKERRVYVKHISCEIDEWGFKHKVGGTYRCRHMQSRVRGKAAVKAAKRQTHTKGYYKFVKTYGDPQSLNKTFN